MTQEETKRLYAAFEVLEGINPQDGNFNKNEYYPHDGIFLLKHADGSMSVVNVTLNKVDAESGSYCCPMFQQCFIGCPNTIDSGRVMDSYEVNEKMDAMRDRYDADLKQKKTELDAEFEQKRMALEHEYEIKKLELEKEMPKRFEQGEWVSGKTLTDIIKTLTGNNSINTQN